MASLRLLLIILSLAVSSCADSATAPSTSSPTTGAAVQATSTTAGAATTEAPTTLSEFVAPAELSDFAVEQIRLDDLELLVAIADTGELRRRGLMQVGDLGDLDGMLFAFDQDSSSGFWMKDTIIPLDIAFFDAAGAFVDGFPMEPCTTAECPTYRPSGTYRYAVEMVAGTMPVGVEELRFNQ